jgi:DNA-binding transcriptional LysR family regulator
MRDLNDLGFFVAVVEHHGFAAAGRALNIPKSRLSRRVALLEEDLGVRLLQRSTRRFAVTEVGQQFLSHCRAMLAEAQAAEDVVASQRAEPRGIVRVSCPHDIAQNLIAPCLPDFLAAFPRVRVQMFASNRRFDLLNENIDIALRVRPVPEMDAELVTRHLARTRKLMVASPAYLDTYGRPTHPRELAQHQTISLVEQESVQHWMFYSSSADGVEPATARVEVEPRLLCGEFAVLLQAALAGAGIAGLPEAVCGYSIVQGKLELVLPDWRASEAVMHLVYASRRGMLPAVRALVDFLVERLPVMVETTSAKLCTEFKALANDASAMRKQIA